MFQSANIAESVTTLFRLHPTLPGLIPGGLLYGIAKPPSAKPYGIMKITLDGEPEYQTGVLYVQTYRVHIQVWSNASLANAGALQAELETLIGAYTKFGLLTNNAWTLFCGLEPASIVEEPERSNQGNVFVAEATWLCQIQENRKA
jgi:hypothetical protein